MNLPGTLLEVAEVIGEERALFLVQNWPKAFVAGKPGHRSVRVFVYVPKKLPESHALIDVLGRDDAERMVRVFGGEQLQLPNCSGNRGGRPARNPQADCITERIDNLATIQHGAMSMPINLCGAAAHV